MDGVVVRVLEVGFFEVVEAEGEEGGGGGG